MEFKKIRTHKDFGLFQVGNDFVIYDSKTLIPSFGDNGFLIGWNEIKIYSGTNEKNAIKTLLNLKRITTCKPFQKT